MCFDNVLNKQSAPSFAKTTISFPIEDRLLREVTFGKGSIDHLNLILLIFCSHVAS